MKQKKNQCKQESSAIMFCVENDNKNVPRVIAMASHVCRKNTSWKLRNNDLKQVFKFLDKIYRKNETFRFFLSSPYTRSIKRRERTRRDDHRQISHVR